MMKQLVLYSTSNCHLCEIAQELLDNHNQLFILNIIDIVDDEKLLTEYGTRIPVLQRVDSATELNWPFNEIELIELLSD